MAHMAALRYPEMFDSIISVAPALGDSGLVATMMSDMVQANKDPNGSRILAPDEAALIGQVLLDRCGALDGARTVPSPTQAPARSITAILA